MKRLRWIVCLIAPAVVGAQNFVALSTSDKADLHFRRMVSPVAMAGAAAGAGIQQWRDRPPEWGQGAEGYGRRYASAHASIVTKNLIALSIDSALGLDPRYRPTLETGVWRRIRGAALQTVVANKDSGGRTFNFWQVGGSYGAGMLSNAWRPENSVTDGLRRGTVGLGISTLKNILTEFWPDVRRLGKRKSP